MEKNLQQAYSQINLRILPFLGICYLFCYIDRINIGFAKLQMQADLAFSDAVYGLGAGIFFIGYIMFEVPSNLLLARIGARKILSPLLILWGMASTSMLWVSDVTTFYILRFLLGAFEAGFAPGILLYLTYWYSNRRLGQAIAIVLCAAPLGGIIGGPMSTWLMTIGAGTHGLAGWQWMFLCEGLPAVVLGIVAFFYLVDKPDDAKWLTEIQKLALATELNKDCSKQRQSLWQILRDPRIYGYAVAYFCLICGVYVAGFWLPTLLNDAGLTDLVEVGIFSAIPYLGAIVLMYFLGRRSDQYLERRLHSSIAALGAAMAFLVVTFYPRSFVITFIGITIATALIFAAYSVFWTIPATYFKRSGAPSGIAVVNSIGLFGGFLSPTIIGWAKTITGGFQRGLMVIVGILITGVVLIVFNHECDSISLKGI